MSQIVPFSFESRQVRVVLDDRGEPRFVAADVLVPLDLDRKALERLDEDEKGVNSIHTPGGVQQMTTVSESGLYSLVLGSRKPEAKRFKRWLAHDVLPSIRKTGSYSLRAAAPALPQDYEEALAALLEKVRENKALTAENAQKEAQLEAQAPAVEFVDKYVEAKSTRSLRDVAKVLGVKQSVFIADLLRWGILYRGRDKRLRVKAPHDTSGSFETKTGEANGITYEQPKFTPAGITWIARRYSAREKSRLPPGEDQAACSKCGEPFSVEKTTCPRCGQDHDPL